MRILLLFILISQSCLLAAQAKIHEGFTLVIAQSGLNIRSAPTLAGKVIAKAPYLSQVEYLSDESFNRDTIGILKSFFRSSDPQGNLVETDVPLAGDWVKVKYNGRVGYTFNVYLSSPQNLVKSPDYFVLSPGENCGDEFFDLTKYYCYGIYGSGEETEVREIKASYIVQETGTGYLAPLITTEDNQELRLVIGSKRELPTADSDFIVNLSRPAWSQKLAPIPVRDCGVLEVKEFKREIPNSSKHIRNFTGYFERGPRKQPLFKDFTINYLSILGCGDLDGDDKVDYLIMVTLDEYPRKLLYLSSIAGDGEVLGLASEEFFGPCC
jgi:hypothetical protein